MILTISSLIMKEYCPRCGSLSRIINVANELLPNNATYALVEFTDNIFARIAVLLTVNAVALWGVMRWVPQRLGVLQSALGVLAWLVLSFLLSGLAIILILIN